MNRFQKFDILINIISPLLIGYALYQPYFRNLEIKLLNNYLADFVWGYAFQSSILIIWDRKIKTVWVLSVISCGIIYEIFQYFHILNGTADIMDISIYLLAILLSLILNKYFLQKYKSRKLYEQANKN